jgi:hypothetical protein
MIVTWLTINIRLLTEPGMSSGLFGQLAGPK